MLIERVIELLLVFVALPATLAMLPRRISPIPLMIIAASVMLGVLLRDPTFGSACLTRLPHLSHNLLAILLPIPLMACLMIGLLYWLAKDQLFRFVRRKPKLWATVMVMYPLMSVVPQTIIYRVYFMHRYEVLFGSGWLMIVMAALAFGFGHVIFRHAVPVLLTTVGGLIFAWRYSLTGSAPLSVLEHSIYGNLAFTIGYSYYLYHGSVRATESFISA